MRIEAKYCGPPASGHGGVSAGRFAEVIEERPVEVRLLAPPPLETELDSRREDDGTTVVLGPDGDVARVRGLAEPLVVEPFSLLAAEEIAAAEAEALRGFAENGHPFPTCFGCGPDREDDDGLEQFAGPVGDGDTVAAYFHVEGDGPLPDWMVWAGLDCPSGFAAGAVGDGGSEAPKVLGSMSAQVLAPVRAGVDYQVRGRLLASKGRKYTTEAAMLDPEGAAVGVARAIWIQVDPSQL